MMKKQEAADYLGVKIRTLEYHVKQGNIGVRYEKGKTGDVAVFDETELRKLKARLEAERAPTHAIDTVPVEGSESITAEPRSLMRLSDVPRQGMQLIDLITAIESARAQTPSLSVVPLHEKLRLTIDEAVRYSGLSRGEIEGAIKSKKLKAEKRGPRRSWIIKREDLLAYNKKH